MATMMTNADQLWTVLGQFNDLATCISLIVAWVGFVTWWATRKKYARKLDKKEKRSMRAIYAALVASETEVMSPSTLRATVLSADPHIFEIDYDGVIAQLFKDKFIRKESGGVELAIDFFARKPKLSLLLKTVDEK